MDYRAECRSMVRRDDPERYVVSLFAPSTSQQNLWSLLAFNQEIAKIRENTSEPMLGEIRLQWWHDVLTELVDGSVREHPVVKGLADLVAQHPNILQSLRNILESRRQDILGEGMVTDASILAYASSVGGSLQKAISTIWTCKDLSDQLVTISETIGSAWCLIGLVRAVPYQWQHGDLQVQTAQVQQILKADDAWERLKPTIDMMVQSAKSDLTLAATKKRSILKTDKPLFLFMTLLKIHLEQLEQVEYNPFKLPQAHSIGAGTLLKLLWAQISRRY